MIVLLRNKNVPGLRKDPEDRDLAILYILVLPAALCAYSMDICELGKGEIVCRKWVFMTAILQISGSILCGKTR